MMIKTMTTRAGHWRVVKVTADEISEIMPKATDYAGKKAEHSMDFGQDGRIRSKSLKFQYQLMGTIAEVMTASYLVRSIEKANLSDKWEVVLYDDVRTDGFRSPEGEYDIKLQHHHSGREFTIEARSSRAYSRSFQDALNQYDIIGRYTNLKKEREAWRDFYARPLYVYLDYKASNYLPSNFEKLLTQQRIELYIVAGCYREQMEHGGFPPKDMNQNGTLYDVVPILKGYDAIGFSEEVVRTLQGAND